MPLHATPRLFRRLTAECRLMDPLLMNTNLSFLSAVVGLTGGGATNLDGVDTSRISKPYLAQLLVAESDGVKRRHDWVCRARVEGENETVAGTNPEDFKFVVPDNWHPISNNVVWERKL